MTVTSPGEEQHGTFRFDAVYVTQLKFFFRDCGDESVATLSAHPPEAAARQGQSSQGINSGINIGEKGRGQLKGSALFEQPTEQEIEADRELALQIWRRRGRKQMKEANVPLVTTAEDEKTRKVSKRAIEESEDNSSCSEEKEDGVHSESAGARTRSSKRGGKKLKVGDVEKKGRESFVVSGEELFEDGEEEQTGIEKPKKSVKKKKTAKKMVRKNAEGAFVLDEAGIDHKYAKSPEHAERIKNLPRREKEIFLHVEERISGKKNPKFLHHLFSSNNAEETIDAFQLTPETYEKVVGEKFEPIKGVKTAVARSGRGTDTIEEAVSNAKSDSWVDGITYVFNLLQDFVFTTPEFRNVDWLRLEVADLDLVLGYFFLWLAPQPGGSALGNRYVPRTLKNIKTKVQKLLENFLKRKDFNLSSGEAQFSKAMYEAKQNLTAKRAGGPGEGVQGDRERQAFTKDDQKRIDEWIMTKVICFPINSG